MFNINELKSDSLSKYRKDKGFYKSIHVINENFDNILKINLYRTSSKHYYCLWINDKKKDLHIHNGESVYGYGFDREKAVIMGVLDKIGFHSDNRLIDSVELLIFLESIVLKLGYKEAKSFVAEG
jgi:hypothetical protein